MISSITESTDEKMKRTRQQMDELLKMCDGQCSNLEKELRTELDAYFKIPAITELSYASEVRVNAEKNHDNITKIVKDVCSAVTCKPSNRCQEICGGVEDLINLVLGGSSGSETKKVKYQVFFRNGGFYRLDMVFYHYHAEGSSLMDGKKVSNALAYRTRSTLLDMQKANPQIILALIDTQSLKLMEQCLVEAHRFYLLLNLVTATKNLTPESGNISHLVDEQKQLENWIGVVDGKTAMVSAPKHVVEQAPAKKGGNKFFAANPMAMLQARGPVSPYQMAGLQSTGVSADFDPKKSNGGDFLGDGPHNLFSSSCWDGVNQPKSKDPEEERRKNQRLRNGQDEYAF